LQFDPANSNTFRSQRHVVRWKYWFPGFLLAVASGVISYAICLTSGELGFALFIAVPVSIGCILGYGTRVTTWLLGILGIMAVCTIVFMLMSMHLAGAFCGLMLSVIFIIPTGFGIVIGLLLRAVLVRTAWDQRWFFPLICFILMPYAVQWIENLLPRRTEIATVATGLTVHATPREVWNAIMFYEEVEHAPPWLLQLALPKPERSVGNKQQVGELIRCYYDRGHLFKRISCVEQDRLLVFHVVEQKLHFERDVTLRGGSFELIPVGPEHTRIVLTTDYERHLRPTWIWQPIERRVIHTLHGHVLEGMRRHAEKPPAEQPERPYERKKSKQLFSSPLAQR
jgi:hypothetical protein